MFNFFSKSTAKNLSYEQAVLIDIDVSKEPIDTQEFLDMVRSFEENLKTILPQYSHIDGDEFSDNQATVYIYGPNADDIYRSIEPILTRSSFNHLEITKQYGRPDDPGTKEKKFTL